MSAKTQRRPGELVFAILILLFSLVMFYQSFLISGFREISGPGVFPMLASGAMVLSGIAIVRASLRLPPPGMAADPRSDHVRRFFAEVTPVRLIVMLALICLYVAAMPLVGFVGSSAGFLFLAIVYLWRKNLLLCALVSAGSLAVIYAVFRLLFQVVLPQGSLWQ